MLIPRFNKEIKILTSDIFKKPETVQIESLSQLHLLPSLCLTIPE